MIDGIGIDVVDIERFKESIDRTPGLREKLFTPLIDGAQVHLSLSHDGGIASAMVILER